MNKQEIINMLEKTNIEYYAIEHLPSETIDAIDKLNLKNSHTIVKNLFLRDDKKQNYYLLVLRKDKNVNLKELRKKIDSRPLSFASENDLFHFLGLKKGAVTPFGILNDKESKVQVIFDNDIMEFKDIGVHPNVNDTTLWLSPKDLVDIIKKHGNKIILLSII